MTGQAPRRLCWRRARRSVRVRLVALFLLLAMAMAATFLAGVGRAFSTGWRDTASPMIADYADRLVAEIGSPPDVQKARALADRLPVAIRIDGPQLHWQSGPDAPPGPRWGRPSDAHRASVVRQTADGHRVELSLSARAAHAGQGEQARIAWITLAALLGLTALASAAVHRMLRPIRVIGDGARRFGSGQFDEPIPVRHSRAPDELNELAQTVNQMAADIRQMLDAKRGLLLAISHELRSPLTRARLNAELLPDTAGTQAERTALLRDLALMRDLIADLLESERLASSHAALQREPTDLRALAQEVIDQLSAARPAARQTRLVVAEGFAAAVVVDPARCRLLLRNLLDNAWRHAPNGAPAPELSLSMANPSVIEVVLRDHGPGVPEPQLQRLSEAFYRPDSARQRTSGGVGLGLYLVRLVAQAHGGSVRFRNATPGLEVRVTLAAESAAADAGERPAAPSA